MDPKSQRRRLERGVEREGLALQTTGTGTVENVTCGNEKPNTYLNLSGIGVFVRHSGYIGAAKQKQSEKKKACATRGQSEGVSTNCDHWGEKPVATRKIKTITGPGRSMWDRFTRQTIEFISGVEKIQKKVMEGKSRDPGFHIFRKCIHK